jgi:hypothetical protein
MDQNRIVNGQCRKTFKDQLAQQVQQAQAVVMERMVQMQK